MSVAVRNGAISVRWFVGERGHARVVTFVPEPTWVKKNYVEYSRTYHTQRFAKCDRYDAPSGRGGMRSSYAVCVALSFFSCIDLVYTEYTTTCIRSL